MLWLSFWEYKEGKPFQINGVWVGYPLFGGDEACRS
jgi:hypothetical protein